MVSLFENHLVTVYKTNFAVTAVCAHVCFSRFDIEFRFTFHQNALIPKTEMLAVLSRAHNPFVGFIIGKTTKHSCSNVGDLSFALKMGT